MVHLYVFPHFSLICLFKDLRFYWIFKKRLLALYIDFCIIDFYCYFFFSSLHFLWVKFAIFIVCENGTLEHWFPVSFFSYACELSFFSLVALVIPPHALDTLFSHHLIQTIFWFSLWALLCPMDYLKYIIYFRSGLGSKFFMSYFMIFNFTEVVVSFFVISIFSKTFRFAL